MEQHSAHSKINGKKSVLTPTMRLQLRQRQRKNQAARTGQLDWEALRTRMSTIGQLAEVKADPALILRERAASLARPIESVVDNATANTLVILQRANCQLAVEVEYVREIVPLESVTYVPGVPEFIVGVINARGKILTLVDLEIFLRVGLGEATSESNQQKQTVIMLQTESFEFGILCDSFPTISQHNSVQFRELHHTSLNYRSDYLKGIGPEGVLLVNLGALIADTGFIVNQV